MNLAQLLGGQMGGQQGMQSRQLPMQTPYMGYQPQQPGGSMIGNLIGQQRLPQAPQMMNTPTSMFGGQLGMGGQNINQPRQMQPGGPGMAPPPEMIGGGMPQAPQMMNTPTSMFGGQLGTGGLHQPPQNMNDPYYTKQIGNQPPSGGNPVYGRPAAPGVAGPPGMYAPTSPAFGGNRPPQTGHIPQFGGNAPPQTGQPKQPPPMQTMPWGRPQPLPQAPMQQSPMQRLGSGNPFARRGGWG